MTMIEDQIISNVTCDVGKQTKISSFLKNEEMSTRPWGKFHLLFRSLSLSSRSFLFSLFFMLSFYNGSYNGPYTMMAKPIRALELHYP